MIYVVENEEKRKKKVFSIVSQSGQRGKLYLSSLSLIESNLTVEKTYMENYF